MSVGEAQTVTVAIIQLIPVVGGALIGVVGGLAGTAYANRLAVRSSQGAERRAKLELLVAAAYEIDVWLKKQENYFLFGGPESLETSPIANIEALAKLYFPTLDAPVESLSLAHLEYRRWLVQGARLRLAANPPLVPTEHTNEVGRVYPPVIEARNALVVAARELMHGLFAP